LDAHDKEDEVFSEGLWPAEFRNLETNLSIGDLKR
jgi:hypothetical protein